MTNSNMDERSRPEELSAFLGKHFIYTYDNGWQYEIYIKNAATIDYRIHSGMVGGRWVRDQEVHLVRLADDIVKISWDEPTGTAVSLAFMLTERKVHGAVFFPRWVADEPQKTVCFQNDFLDLMRQCRDAGPTYPRLVIDEFATITFAEDCGQNNQEVGLRPRPTAEGLCGSAQLILNLSRLLAWLDRSGEEMTMLRTHLLLIAALIGLGVSSSAWGCFR